MSTFRNSIFSGLLATLVASGFASDAAAQSFDCGPYLDRRQAPETVICQTPQLQSLDEQLAGLYFNLMDRLQSSRADALRSSQRNWLASRDTCGFNANCLVGRYNQRISVLRSY